MSKTGTAKLIVDGKCVHDCNIYTYNGILEKDDYKRIIICVLSCNHEQAMERVHDGIAKGWANSALMMTHHEITQVPLLITVHKPQL